MTVSYSMPHDLFFAPVLGFGDSNDIATTATAAWGPISGGNAIPIVLESGQFQTSCDIPNVPVDTECWFWYDPGVNGIGVANWGFLDMQSWPATAAENTTAADCGGNGSNSANDDAEAILNDYDVTVNLFLPHTYVCTQSGNREGVWFDALQARLDGICPNSGHGCQDSDGVAPYDDWPGPSVLMPVNDCDAQINQSGQVIPCGAPDKPYKYAIIGFTTLRLLWILQGNDDSTTDGSPAAVQSGGTAGSGGTCSNKALSTNALGTYLLGGWNLNNVAANQCGASQAPDTLTNVVIKNGGGAMATAYQQCPPSSNPAPSCDYVWDPATRMVSWHNAANRTAVKRVTFDWSIAGDAPDAREVRLRGVDPERHLHRDGLGGIHARAGSDRGGRRLRDAWPRALRPRLQFLSVRDETNLLGAERALETSERRRNR